eukprot:TRINITY_DN17309_c0_g1_i1.p1 TRINITY_DN17309_c0_g1~~TRINITY_DN17309_c0_g1_i1.p1  ORF type:complete len:496 (+),score=90.18 TRINITY_DN17309_c0_g1_i1:252-1739(+)
MATGNNTYLNSDGTPIVFDLASESFLPWNVATASGSAVTASTMAMWNNAFNTAFVSGANSLATSLSNALSSKGSAHRTLSPPSSTDANAQPAAKRSKPDPFVPSSSQGESPPAAIYALTTPFTQKPPAVSTSHTAPCSLSQLQPSTLNASLLNVPETLAPFSQAHFPQLDRVPSTSRPGNYSFGSVRPTHDPFLASLSPADQAAKEQQCQLWLSQLKEGLVQVKMAGDNVRRYVSEFTDARRRVEDTRATLLALAPELKGMVSELTAAHGVDPVVQQIVQGAIAQHGALHASIHASTSSAAQSTTINSSARNSFANTTNASADLSSTLHMNPYTSLPSSLLPGMHTNEDLTEISNLLSNSFDDVAGSLSGFTSFSPDGGLIDPTDLAHTMEQLIAVTSDSGSADIDVFGEAKHPSSTTASKTMPASTSVSSLAVPADGNGSLGLSAPTTRARQEETPPASEPDAPSGHNLSSLAVPVSQVPRHMLFQMEKLGSKR